MGVEYDIYLDYQMKDVCFSKNRGASIIHLGWIRVSENGQT